jgi:hypothetical protein
METWSGNLRSIAVFRISMHRLFDLLFVRKSVSLHNALIIVELPKLDNPWFLRVVTHSHVNVFACRESKSHLKESYVAPNW